MPSPFQNKQPENGLFRFSCFAAVFISIVNVCSLQPLKFLVEVRYEGEPCVIKVFDLHMHRGLPGFIQEVMLHVRPELGKLRGAGLGWQELAWS